MVLTSAVKADLVGWWKLDEGSGATASDSSGNGNNLTLNGPPQWVTGVIEGALDFDGNDDVSNDPVSNVGVLQSASVTVTAWVKISDLSGEDWVAGQGDNYGLVVDRGDGSDDVFFYYFDGTIWPNVSSGDVNIGDGEWHKIGGAYDDEFDKLYVYKDGVKVGTATSSNPIVYSLGNGFTIGSMKGDRFFTGTIDDVRVYDHVQKTFTELANPGGGDFGDGQTDHKAAWGDYNNDGWVDLLACGKLWRNNNGSSFMQVAELGDGIFGDYDNDGYLDIFRYGQRELFRNNEGAGYVKQPLPTLPTGHSIGAAWGDFDNDGYLDIYVGGNETWQFPSHSDFILVNNRDGTFRVGWVQSDISGYANRARGVSCCDWDRDDDIDVYVSNYRIYPNILWRNDGNGIFSNVAPTHNAEAGAGHSIGAAWGDFDNDGLFDLFAGNFAHSGQPQSRFLRNRGESADFQFEDLGPRDVYYQESYASPAAGDYDNDGKLDLYFTTVYWPGNRPVLFRNDGSWNFAPVSDAEGLGEVGPTYQAAFADFDNDGDLDLLTDGRLFVNQGNSNHWLKLRLQGDGQHVNRAAIGAQVRIETAGQTLTRQVESGTGEGNQNELVLHFGLGEHNGPVDVQINWPDGTEQTVENVPVNQMVVIKQTKSADLNYDGRVDTKDYCKFAEHWSQDKSSADIAPQPFGDGRVDFKDLGFFVEKWLTATTIPPLPEEASNASPANNAMGVVSTANLSWTAGTGAISHDVYIGTSNPPPFLRNQTTTTYVTVWLPYETKFYWRIDEINGWGKTEGTVWNFTTMIQPPPPPGQASNPNPADGATGVGIEVDLSWTPGPGSTSHDVYFGTSILPPFIRNQTAITFDPGRMGLSTKYYWRINEHTAFGRIAGPLWSFTTTTIPPPPIGHASNPSPVRFSH